MIGRSLLVVSIALLFAGTAAFAQSPEANGTDVERRIKEITHDMRCPCNCTMTLPSCVCQEDEHPGQSPWQSAYYIKTQMRNWMAQGRSDAEIRELLIKNVGEIILDAPTFKGFNLVLYFGIPAVVLVGLGIVFAVARRLTVRPALAVAIPIPTPTSIEPESRDPLLEGYRARIEEELRAFWR